jgi:hypothetical protein
MCLAQFDVLRMSSDPVLCFGIAVGTKTNFIHRRKCRQIVVAGCVRCKVLHGIVSPQQMGKPGAELHHAGY